MATQKQALFADLFEEEKVPKKSLAKKDSEEKNDHKKRKRRENFSTTADLLAKYQVQETNKHIAHEFQSFGCHLANQLADRPHTALYIKLAKNTPRSLLERALSFVSDADHAKSKARLFMWKLGQLKVELKEKAKKPATFSKMESNDGRDC